MQFQGGLDKLGVDLIRSKLDFQTFREVSIHLIALERGKISNSINFIESITKLNICIVIYITPGLNHR